MAPQATKKAGGLPRRRRGLPLLPEADIDLLSGSARFWRFVKWLKPLLFCMFGFYLQSVGLHYATYTYIQRRHMLISSMPNATWNAYHNLFEVLVDPLEDALGPQRRVQLGCLDAVAGFFPMLFMLISFIDFMQELTHGKRCPPAFVCWTKTMTCAGFLFILKGSLAAMTSVPDSSGWEVCKLRLHDEGVSWMSQPHSFFDMLFVDSWWLATYREPLRYCGDMMFSGHTFVVTLFALASYELTCIAIEDKIPPLPCLKGDRGKSIAQAICLLVISTVAIAEQAIEIYFVEISRFHYSADVFMALILTFLFFSNGAISVYAKQWEVHGFRLLHLFDFSNIQSTTRSLLREHVDTLESGYHQLAADAQRGEQGAQEDSELQLERAFKAQGDVFLPICCVPFCCLAGRQHIYSDRGLKALVDLLAEEEERKAIKKTMHLHEGVSMEDIKSLFGLAEGKFSSVKESPSLRVKTSEKETQQSWFAIGAKWSLPMCFAMLGFYVQNVGLYAATYTYVHKMLEVKAALPIDVWETNIKLYESLGDPLEDSLGPKQAINLKHLNYVAAACPVVFACLLVVDFLCHRGKYTLEVWTKLMLCAGFLYIFQGLGGAMTNLASSDGWNLCANQLHEEGLQYMSHQHSLGDMVMLDYQWNVLWYRHPLPQCSNMVIGVHTFLVTLSALGCYEIMRIKHVAQQHAKLRILMLICFSCFAVVEQAIEIYCVLTSHYSYSMDITLAITCTFLIYTNGAIAVASKIWERKGLTLLSEFSYALRSVFLSPHEYSQIPYEKLLLRYSNKEYADQVVIVDYRGQRLPVFVSKVAWDEEASKLSLLELEVLLEKFERALPESLEDETHLDGDAESSKRRESIWHHMQSSTLGQEIWVTRGDVFLPPCCVPCCCFAGRQHVYSDTNLENVMTISRAKEQKERLKRVLHFHEGITWNEFLEIIGRSPDQQKMT